MTLTAIVIDDSPLQQMATCKLIENHPNIQLVDFFNDPIKGLAAVNSLRPDVLFLDIEMPELNGFDILNFIEYDCQVILNSTRSQFALHAFQYDHVKDYLVKPMNKSRFEKSIDKVLKNQVLEKSAKFATTEYVWIERLPKAS
ncbi:response regulator [Muricauda sp. JGD-17]|uniref:Response regulator n=1 Tax=Flagellimonas ochracea TaxID=2696472 RepID=A0A964WXQ9_9FLAO|nr:response regulator [Allomuricauda ochracea]NAY92396.1 response regulator [Allomuricauda ochracea]